MTQPAPMAWPISPPTMAPTMPSRRVIPMPIGLRPGTTSRPSAPTMRPTMTIVTMRVSTGTSEFQGARRCASSKVCPARTSGHLDGSKADASALGLGDLDINQLVGRNDQPAALVIGQRERRSAFFQRGLDRRLQLFGGQGRVDRQLSQGALDADPDLHAIDPMSPSPVSPRRTSPYASLPLRRWGDHDTPGNSGKTGRPTCEVDEEEWLDAGVAADAAPRQRCEQLDRAVFRNPIGRVRLGGEPPPSADLGQTCQTAGEQLRLAATKARVTRDRVGQRIDRDLQRPLHPLAH